MTSTRVRGCPSMRPRKVKLPQGTIRVYLHDEAPRLGCGWRLLILLSLGPKWARVRDVSTENAARLPRATWAQIGKRGAKEID